LRTICRDNSSDSYEKGCAAVGARIEDATLRSIVKWIAMPIDRPVGAKSATDRMMAESPDAAA